METSSQTPSFGQGLELASIIEKALASAVKKTKADSDKIQKVIGRPGVFYKFFEDLLAGEVNQIPAMFNPLFVGKTLLLEANDGKKFIYNSKKTFKSYIDSDFKDMHLNKPDIATPETLVEIKELIVTAMFKQIFPALNSDFDKLLLTQSQIIRFCEKYPNYLRQDGEATFFLTKKNKKYFVVVVDVDLNGLSAYVYPFWSDDIWSDSRRLRLVIPANKPLTK